MGGKLVWVSILRASVVNNSDLSVAQISSSGLAVEVSI
jgi:hypothetical protein